MAIAASLIVDLRLRAAKYIDGLKKARNQQNRFRREAEKTRRQLKTLAISFAAVAGPAALVLFISRITQADDEIRKMSKNLGVATETLSAWEFAAGIAGVSTQDLLTGIRRLQKNISDADKGLTTAIRAFDDLGVSYKALLRLSPERQFEIVADALSKIELQAVKARVALDIFGRSGVKLIEMTKNGAAGINAMKTELMLLGGVLTTDVASANEEWVDAMLRIKTALIGVGRQTAALRNQSLTDLANDLAFKIPAAAFAMGRGIKGGSAEAVKAVSALGETLSIVALAGAKTAGFFPFASLFISDKEIALLEAQIAGFREAGENAALALLNFDKETQAGIDKIFDFKFPDSPTKGGLGGALNAALGITDDGKEIVTKYWMQHQQEIQTTVEQWRVLNDTVMNYTDELNAAESEVNKLNDVARDLGFTFESAFENAIIKGEGFRDVLGGVFEDIQRIILRKTITEKVGGFVADLIGNIDFGFGGGGGSSTQSTRAHGGPVTAGAPYIVGERGPELFVPQTSGTVIPNINQSSVINVSVSVDARGSEITEARLSAVVEEGTMRAYQMVINDLQRNGPVRRSL